MYCPDIFFLSYIFKFRSTSVPKTIVENEYIMQQGMRVLVCVLNGWFVSQAAAPALAEPTGPVELRAQRMHQHGAATHDAGGTPAEAEPGT